MNSSSQSARPLLWLILIGLLALLAFWYFTRTSPDGAILSAQQKKALERDLQAQTARRQRDSLAEARSDSAAATLYRQGQHSADAARRLHQRTHETTATSDTTAAELQRELTDY